MTQTILIIEDSETMIELYKGLLNPRDERVIDVASTESEALYYMKRSIYDLYIIDIVLKGGSEGTDLIGKGGAVPDKCIIMSGNLTEQRTIELMSLYKLERDHCMNKPPNKKEFLKLVEEILKQNNSHNNESTHITDDNTNHIEEERERTYNEIVNWHVIWHLFKTMSIHAWAILILVVVIGGAAISTYASFIGYKEFKQFENSFNQYCENRFKNFKPGIVISNRTYVENIIIIDGVELITRVYPSNFVSVLITTNKSFEPRHHWLASPEYADKLGLDENKSFIQIILDIYTGARKL